MNVLSLFDGISCGNQALKNIGIKPSAYYASEIEPNAIKVALHNFPKTVQIGDVRTVSYSNGILKTKTENYNAGKIDLLKDIQDEMIEVLLKERKKGF